MLDCSMIGLIFSAVRKDESVTCKNIGVVNNNHTLKPFPSFDRSNLERQEEAANVETERHEHARSERK